MQIPLSDIIDTYGQDLFLESDTSGTSIEDELNFLEDFKKILEKHNKPTEQVDYLINKLEGNMDIENIIQIFGIDENSIREKVEKHPYFKNPCGHPIRLITIMKYLKKKGINTSLEDMDLVVDRLVQAIPEVQKIGDGLYLKCK